jgi:hypothetical protein
LAGLWNQNENTPSNFEALWERGKTREEKEKDEKEDIDGCVAGQPTPQNLPPLWLQFKFVPYMPLQKIKKAKAVFIFPFTNSLIYFWIFFHLIKYIVRKIKYAVEKDKTKTMGDEVRERNKKYKWWKKDEKINTG